MSRRRIAAALAVCGALLVAPHLGPAEATTHGPQDVAAAPSRAVVKPLIQGVVVDQDGRPVDDVDVRATRADGTVEASARTYASGREDGPQHGYFFVEVPRGDYTLTLRKQGYETVERDAGRIARQVHRISLGELVIRKLVADTTTSARLARATVTTKEHGSVVVSVSTAATKRPAGAVEIREGRHVVGRATLRSANAGKVTIALARLPTGAHRLTAYFLGTTTLKASTSKGLTLTVVRGRH